MVTPIGAIVTAETGGHEVVKRSKDVFRVGQLNLMVVFPISHLYGA